MANLLKSLPSLTTIAIAAAAATAAQIMLANPPLRLPDSVRALPAWLATSPNPWVLLTALLAALAFRRAWALRCQRRRAPEGEFDPNTLVVLQGFSPGEGDPPEFRAMPERGAAIAPLSPGERDEALMLGLYGAPLPEEIARVGPGAPPSILPQFEAAIARRLLERRLALAVRLDALDPGHTPTRMELFDTHRRLGDAAMILGELTDAEKDFKAAAAVAETLTPADPDSEVRQTSLFAAWLRLSWLAEKRGDRREAIARLERGEAALASMARRDPGRRDLAEPMAAIRDILTQTPRTRSASHVRDPEPPDWALPKPEDSETFSGGLESFFDV